MPRLLRRYFKTLTRRNWRPIVAPYARLFENPPDPMQVSRAEIVRQSEEGPLVLWPPREIATGPVKYVIVSPHLDDAPLSLGGRMLQWGNQCLVLDLFSTVSWWRFEITSHEDPRIQTVRDAEEDLVAELTGATVRRIGLMEAPRRGYPLAEIFTAEILPTEQAGQTVRAAVKALAAEGSFEWFLPLGIGNHVDHRIARQHALAALIEAGVPKERIRFYEDLPYAAQTPGLKDYSGFMPGHKLEPGEETLIDVKLKMTLLRVYWSQLTLGQIAGVGAYAQRAGRRTVERVWRLKE